MKKFIKKIVLAISTYPVIGPFVRFFLNIIRRYRRPINAQPGYNQYLFETQQLPKLLEMVSELKHQQLSNDQNKDNLIKSIPVTLRNITQDSIKMQNEIKSQANIINMLLDRITILENQTKNYNL